MTDTKKAYFAHESAVLDQGCEIGAGTKIWHFCHISEGVKIGTNCKLGQNVYVGRNVVVGNNVKIQNNVSLYEGVTLEDDVFCGPSMVFTNVTNPRSHMERKHEFKSTLVRKGVSIGANATIICGATLGQYSFIGANGLVTKDVPAHALMYGVPTRQKGWMCQCGHRLEAAKEKLTCIVCGTTYELTKEGLVGH